MMMGFFLLSLGMIGLVLALRGDMQRNWKLQLAGNGLC
jgi:hypothetical protein